MLLRFGVLPLVAAAFVHVILLRLPLTLDLSAWYSGASLVALGSILAVTLWSFRAALGGRQVWKGNLLDSDSQTSARPGLRFTATAAPRGEYEPQRRPRRERCRRRGTVAG